jgi:phenylalanyl-tRNA synthetase alpha chain
MNYTNSQILDAAGVLKARQAEMTNKSDILKAIELKALFDQIKTLAPEERKAFGQELNSLRQELKAIADEQADEAGQLAPIDITAPFDINAKLPSLFSSELGSRHPINTEIERIVDIFYRMGFTAVDSPELDDDYHMFESLNFPEGHPARDDYDTFMTTQTDSKGKPFVSPAHTSTMEHRVFKNYKANLDKGEPIAVVIPGRVFRNEDIDVTHEHTFYQLEGVYVGKKIHAGHLIATLQTYLSEYFQQDLKAKIQPFYFPFTEPSFEFAVERPDILRKNDSEEQKWLELGGCGMTHPNVLRAAGIDPEIYTGFAWGFGIERMVMMKNSIEDIRHFESGKLEFLRQFS